MKGCLDINTWDRWSPIISLSMDGIQWGHIRFSHWLMCQHHQQTIGLEDLIDGPLLSGASAWEHIQSSFAKAGKGIPLREFAKLTWEPA